MAVYTLNIQDYIYVKMDIESSPVTPTMNLIQKITIQDGFGIAIPTLTLELYDQKGTLMQDLLIADGTRINISIAKRAEAPQNYSFLVFNFRQSHTQAGPVLEITALLNIPMYSCASFRRVFNGTSNNALSEIARLTGLRYSGTETQDSMKWLAVCNTLSSFTEDIAMYGYAHQQSCMARIVLAEQELRYRDLFKQLQQPVTTTILHDCPEDNVPKEGQHYTSREIKDTSVAGVMNHFLNYGYTVATHRLEGQQLDITQAQPPRLGSNLPINADIKKSVGHARIEYGLHFDPGHYPHAANNVHQYWEEARYQNMRYLSMFSERLRMLVEDQTVTRTLDTVKAVTMRYEDDILAINKRTSGKYICGGKTLCVINGDRYYEVLDLYRPFLENTGVTNLV